MTVLATIMLWLLYLVGGLLVLVLVTPIGLRAAGAVTPWQATGFVEARWGLGLLGVRLSREHGLRLRVLGIRVYRVRFGRDSTVEDKKDKDEQRDEKGGRGPLWAWRNRSFFIRVLHALHFRGTISGTIGLGDPADTAVLSLALTPIVERLPGFDARLDWDYLDDRFELDGAVRVRVWPIELVYILLATLLRRRTRRALLATS